MNSSVLILIVGGIALLIILLRILFKPIKLALKLFLHALLGFVGLYLTNFFGSSVGIFLPLTWGNALVAGLFGIPGIILLVILKFFVGM